MEFEVARDTSKALCDMPQKTFLPSGTIISLIAEQAKLTPEKVVIIEGDLSVSYEQLLARSDAFAAALAERGVKSGSLVGVCMSRSWDLIATLLGVLRAGCAYVPLDPAYPQERVHYMLSHSKASAAIVENEHMAHLCQIAREVIHVDTIKNQAIDNVPGPEPTDLAYVIYTSGSTGKPKGVAVEHRNVVAMSHAMAELFSSEELSGVLAAASVCFDTSVMEIFGTLSLGGTILMADNALALPKLPYADKVKMCVMVPSSMQTLLGTDTLPDSIRCVVFGGEALKAPLVNQIHNLAFKPRVMNAYGPTEDTVFSTINEITEDTTRITIGRSVVNSRAYILNDAMQCTAIGEPGELYLAGSKLTRGYLNDENMTTSRFVTLTPTDLIPETRLYKTGDLCQWSENAEIEFLGRIDQQVKIRGFRIELGEVESVLESMSEIDVAAAAALDSGTGQQILVAYVVNQKGSVTSKAVKAFLSERLPKYMVPQFIMQMSALPFLPNDKLDRKSLPDLNTVRLAAQHEASGQVSNKPQVGYEYSSVLLTIQTEVASLLNIAEPEQVLCDLPFDSFGVDSLSSLELLSRLRAELEYKLPQNSLVLYSTPRALTHFFLDRMNQSVSQASSESSLMTDHNNPKLETLSGFQTLLQSSHPTFQSASAPSWSIADKSVLVEQVTDMVNNNQRNPYGKVLRTGSSATGVIGDSYNKEQDRKAIIWSTNLYFGLNRDPKVINEAVLALERFGTGMGISAAATGMTDQHVEFENEFAELVGKPSACLFPTGYTANLGAISGILGKNDTVVIDQLCHASIVDGARLSGAKIRTFQHNSASDLASVLASETSPYHTTLVVLESVYSMGEGTAPVAEIVRIAKQYGALTLVDEAHSFGFYGHSGAGVCSQQGATDDVDFIMTTLSKALGSIGGVIAASKKHIALLKSSSRAYIFQASISPADIAAALASLRYLRTDDSLREQLWDRTRYMRKRFTEAGYDLGTGDGPIVTPHFGDKDKLYAIVQGLYERGIQTLAVTYPIVEMGRGRLRFICSAAHTHADIDRTLEALIETEQEVNRAFAASEDALIAACESNLDPQSMSTNVQNWINDFSAYLKLVCKASIETAPELVLSIVAHESQAPISIMLRGGKIILETEYSVDLPYCTVSIADPQMIKGLCETNVQALLNSICNGACVVKGQTEVFIWFIARLCEYQQYCFGKPSQSSEVSN
ncbi:amino acid adenylation domain-containing protein [Pseudoalteromonas sp. MMG005]|uniref:amino acid adenylation domain-containing protein n=1 Tax=Pseudoalteromonas sp. MMG005 TaxID=2822682 RepID=UPI001B3A19F0|nr:amino acid adenylation domain-containing protein [Pseudoalteromonas sp. MMG005]MBQ4845341.1 amino acid adenylation domain-containing protein [Pseudoalteromonas sp. MMG005]